MAFSSTTFAISFPDAVLLMITKPKDSVCGVPLTTPSQSLLVVLTLPAIHGRRFFLHPARLLVFRGERRVEAVCPEALSSEEDVSLCPRVHAKAFARMFRAALWSLSKTTPQLGQMCVRTLKDFFTSAPHVLHSWLVN